MEYKIKLKKLNASGTAREEIKLDIVLEQQLSDLIEYFLTISRFDRENLLYEAKILSIISKA